MPESPETPRRTAEAGPDSKSGEMMRASLERKLAGAVSEGAEPDPPPVPDHTLLHRIGSGAYGDVWLARSALGTLRAVKVVYRARFKDDRPYEREFHGILKYEPISRTHEGLVQVLHVGRDEARGCFYYVMELADDAGLDAGRSILDTGCAHPESGIQKQASSIQHPRFYQPRTLRSELSRQQRLAPAEAARFVLRLAGALGHLHAQGLVHRDIKPSNVIFVGGRPKLADIGLVTDVGSSHSFVGTEGFIPPEGPGTPQADLYGLGKLLYELATGRDRMDFPQLPAGVTRLPDGEALLELNEVMTRACAPNLKQRYSSATELQAELNLFLAGRSLRQARHVERNLARLRKFAAAACVLLALGAIALWLAKNEERHATERAHAEAVLRQRAQEAGHESRRQLYSALLEQARATVRSGELGQRVHTLDAIRRAAAISNTVELRREAFAALALPDLRFERELPTGLDCTLAVLDPKFERLALGQGTNAVEIRSVPDQRLLATLPASRYEPAIAGRWSPDGRFLAVRRKQAGVDGKARVEIWDVSSARQILLLPRSWWGAFAFHPSLPRVLGDSGSNSVSVWNLEDRQLLARFSVTGLIHHLEFSPDGTSFLVQHRIERPWFTTLHGAQSGAVRKTVLSGWIDGLAWHPRDRWIAFAARNGEVHLHDRTTDTTSLLGRHKNEARTAVFSPDGDFLFTGGEEQEIICWDLRLQQRVFNISLQSARLQFREDGGQCAVFTRSGALLHSFEHSVPHRELAGDLGGGLRHATVSPDGRWLAVGGLLRLGLWDLTRTTPAAMAWEAEYAKPFFSPNGSELFAFWGETLARWRIRTGPDTTASPPALAPLPVPETSRVHFGQFISNSLVLCTQHGVHWAPPDAVTSEAADRLGANVVSGPASGNGRWVVTRFSRIAFVYELSPWKKLRDWHLDAESLPFVFTPRSDELAMVTMNGVTFLDTDNWEPKRSLSAPLDRNARLIFTPDGRAFWLARDARTAALHDIQTFETFLQLPSRMTPLALSPDGRHLALSVDTRRVQLWDLAEVRRRFRELGLDWVGR